MFQQMQSLVEKHETTMVTLLLKSTINWTRFTAGLKAVIRFWAQVYLSAIRLHPLTVSRLGCQLSFSFVKYSVNLRC